MMADIEVIHGDCLEVMAGLRDEGLTFSSICTDPPYHLTSKPGGKAGFMGKQWDGGDIAMRPETWRLALDVLEPGGMLAAFGGSRTQHRMAVAIEDAGFEIRDVCMWLYGSGMPKSRALLKPSYEPIILARKPGPLRMLNIDECRVSTEEVKIADRIGGTMMGSHGKAQGYQRHAGDGTSHIAGRFPANILHDGSDEVMGAFAVFGSSKSGVAVQRNGGGQKIGGNGIYGGSAGLTRQDVGFGDSGTAARFFYAAKASKYDRCDSKHPTVKPISLMRWLARLITPANGTILDPFAGSGTTLAAAHLEGFHAVGIEREAEYVADVRRRIAALAAAAQPAPLGGLFAAIKDAAE